MLEKILGLCCSLLSSLTRIYATPEEQADSGFYRKIETWADKDNLEKMRQQYAQAAERYN